MTLRIIVGKVDDDDNVGKIGDLMDISEFEVWTRTKKTRVVAQEWY